MFDLKKKKKKNDSNSFKIQHVVSFFFFFLAHPQLNLNHKTLITTPETMLKCYFRLLQL